MQFLTLDDPDVRAAAAADPRAFVDRPVDTLVIDEVQLEPQLFRAIKAEIDRDRRPGRFLLTGSSRLLSAPDMADALVGRVDLIDLWPFSASEMHGSPGRFVDLVIDDPRRLLEPAPAGQTAAQLRAAVIDAVTAGGFPEATRRSARRRGPWFDSYLRTSIERSQRSASALQRTAEMSRLLRLCAARTGQELNVSSLATELGVPRRTLDSQLSQLAELFLIHLVPAWSTNLSTKVVRRPKLVMLDCGLAAHQVGVGPEQLAQINGPLGALLESFVVTEILKQATWSARRPVVHHFRDRTLAEVDVVLEYPDGRVVGIEVKATSTPRAEDFRGLRFLSDRLGSRFAFGAVLSSAPTATTFGSELVALPIDVLWRF